MTFAEVQKFALAMPDSDRAALAVELVESLSPRLIEEDAGVVEALRRSKELDGDPSMGCSWEEIKRDLRG